MTTYLFTYRAPKGYVPGQAAAMEAWNEFFEKLGGHVVDPGNPVLTRTSVGDCGSDVGALGGFSIIEATDLEAAAALAKGCPFVAVGGGVEVGEITKIEDMRAASEAG